MKLMMNYRSERELNFRCPSDFTEDFAYDLAESVLTTFRADMDNMPIFDTSDEDVTHSLCIHGHFGKEQYSHLAVIVKCDLNKMQFQLIVTWYPNKFDAQYRLSITIPSVKAENLVPSIKKVFESYALLAEKIHGQLLADQEEIKEIKELLDISIKYQQLDSVFTLKSQFDAAIEKFKLLKSVLDNIMAFFVPRQSLSASSVNGRTHLNEEMMASVQLMLEAEMNDALERGDEAGVENLMNQLEAIKLISHTEPTEKNQQYGQFFRPSSSDSTQPLSAAAAAAAPDVDGSQIIMYKK